MKNIVILIVLIESSCFLAAQQNYNNVTGVKNKVAFRKTALNLILFNINDSGSAEKNVFFYHPEKNGDLTKEIFKRHSNPSFRNSNFKAENMMVIELGYVIGMGDISTNTLLLNGIYGYKVKPCFFVGIGTGLSYNLNRKDASINLFTDYRCIVINKKVTAFLDLVVGCSFDVTNEFAVEGIFFLLNPSGNVKFSVSEKSDLYVGIGYYMQKWKSGSVMNTNGISTKVGFTF